MNLLSPFLAYGEIFLPITQTKRARQRPTERNGPGGGLLNCFPSTQATRRPKENHKNIFILWKAANSSHKSEYFLGCEGRRGLRVKCQGPLYHLHNGLYV